MFSKILLSNLPPLLNDFRLASLFCVRLIVQCSPAVLPLCGLNTAGEPCEHPAVSRVWLPGYIGYPSTERLLGGGLRLGTAAPVQRGPWPKCAQEAAKRRPRRLLFRICFLMPFWIDFLSIFPPNLAPFWPPKSKKIGEKSMSRWLLIITSFFDRFLLSTSTPRSFKTMVFP